MVDPEDNANPQADSVDAQASDAAESAEPNAAEAADADAPSEDGADDVVLSLDELQDQLDKAAAQVEEYRDKALRAEAEMMNVRRRAEKDVGNAHKFALERFLQSLLPTVDSLEKAIDAVEQAKGDGASEDPMYKGVTLCLKMLLEVMGKENVVVIDPHGEPFDPQEHEAISMIESPDMEPNSVVAVIQRGYKLNERLVRPAMVIVSRGPSVEGPAKVDELV